jgi:hypothetical protein
MDNSSFECEQRIKNKWNKPKKPRKMVKNYHEDHLEKLFDNFDFSFARKSERIPCIKSSDGIVRRIPEFHWREMFLEMVKGKEQWRDSEEDFKRTPYDDDNYGTVSADEKTRNPPNVIRLLVSGPPSADKHVFVNKLVAAFGGSTNKYNVALPFLSQVITLTVGSETVMLYIVDKPYHFAKHFRGSCHVNGIIFCVNPEEFPTTYEQEYRNFHDIAGEFHLMELYVWVVGVLAEHYEVTNKPDSYLRAFNSVGWVPQTYRDSDDFSTLNNNEVVAVIENVLRCNALTTCSWYNSARCAISDTQDNNLLHTGTEFISMVRRCVLRVQETEEEYYQRQNSLWRYPYSSDEEDSTNK